MHRLGLRFQRRRRALRLRRQPSSSTRPGSCSIHRHPNVTAEHNHPVDAQHFFADVVRALQDAEEILIVGPAHAKLELIKYVHKHQAALAAKIVGVETVDHPTDGQLVAYARRYFRVAGSPRLR